ncbi:MAG: hypothetical protein QOE23_1140, partial [Pseudonocardiales bacterium]|nr:hypothetical protein [Pseudonocardiales bacterium]
MVSCGANGPEDPHLSTISARQGKIEVKAGTDLVCEAAEPALIQASITLEKRSFFDLIWLPVATGSVTGSVVPGESKFWPRSQLFALTACVPGTYRARLSLSAQTLQGPVIIRGNGLLSAEKSTNCKLPHVSMVIDDTGSMGSVIGSVSSSLNTFIGSKSEDEYTRWSLTTFKDGPTTVGTTDDRKQALSWVNGLNASGGDDCPEDALGGITSGLSALGTDPDTDKQMIVATDASAHGGDVSGIIAAAQASGTRVNVLLTGDCGMSALAATSMGTASSAFGPPVSSQVVLRRIAEETGGKYFFLPGGTRQDFTAALDAIFAGIADPGEDSQPPTVTLTGVPSTIWSPNHKMVEVTPTV